MWKNLKMWLTDLLTDKRTDRRRDKRVAGVHYCWGVLLWPPQLGLGGKCDKKWKFKNVEKITSFSDAVTLTFDLRPWKVNQVRTLSLPMCIPNLRTIHPVVFELSRKHHCGRRVAGGGRLRRKTITSPDPSDTGDIINSLTMAHLDLWHYLWEIAGVSPLENSSCVISLSTTCTESTLQIRNIWVPFR